MTTTTEPTTSTAAAGTSSGQDGTAAAATTAVSTGDAWRAYFEATALLSTELERRLKDEAGLDLGDFNVLLVLSEAPDAGIRLGELARAVAFHPARLTYRLRVLESRGWVLRAPCAEDGRGSVAILTRDGRRAFRRARLVHATHVHELFLDDLTSQQAQVLHDVFSPLRDALAGRG